MMGLERASEDSSLDLALAAEVQSALLPKACPTDCPHHLAAARNRMCRGVGGDFYDFIRINNDQIALLIGDVVGHGVRASLVMAQIMGYLRSRPPTLARPVQIISTLNHMLLDLGRRTDSVIHCSMFYAVIDAPTGVSIFVNAGHPRPFICNPDQSLVLHMGPQSLLLGVKEFDPIEGCHTFSPPERMILYTDGLIDADDGSDNRFGVDRLHQTVSDLVADGPDQCADGIFRAVDEFRGNAIQNDDETVVVVDRI